MRTLWESDESFVSLSICGSDEIRLLVPTGEWQFVDAGVFTLAQDFSACLRPESGTNVLARRLMFHPEIPGARETAFDKLVNDSALESSIERQESLRALGYVE
jgi:hypothetical protein